MEYAESILDLVGNTPLVRLTRITRELGPADRQPLILAKLEALNPGGSVKDRIGLPMIEAAERDGLLKPGGTIIEPTSGNTGHGLAIAAALKGYRCIFVMADKQSPEKQALLRAYGAEVVLCPTNVAPESPESYYSVARRLARDIPGAFQPDQYSNQENPRAHERTTGPEIWRQTDGRITHLVVASGTGGTISGIGHYLRQHKPDVVIVGADPEGSVLSGDTARPYLTEGVGEDFFPTTYDPTTVDRWVRVSDADAFNMARRVTREEGILAGESTGTAMVATLTIGRELLACRRRQRQGDRGHLSRRRSQLHLEALQRRVDARERPPEVNHSEGSRRRRAAQRPSAPRASARRAGANDRSRRRCNRSASSATASASCRLPSRRRDDSIGAIVGSISERESARARLPRTGDRRADVGEVMDRPLPQIERRMPPSMRHSRCCLRTRPHVVAVTGDRPAGVITKLDLLEYLAHRPDR